MVKRQNQKQKQSQTTIVNVNLGKRKGKGKAKGKSKGRESKTQYIHPFNPAPIFNFPPNFPASFPTNIGNPLLPPPQRVAFPESQIAPLVNLNPTVPVPFSFQGAETKLKAKEKEPKLVAPEAKAEEEVVLPVAEEPPEEEELSVASSLTAPTVDHLHIQVEILLRQNQSQANDCLEEMKLYSLSMSLHLRHLPHFFQLRHRPNPKDQLKKKKERKHRVRLRVEQVQFHHSSHL